LEAQAVKVLTTPIFDLAERARAVVTGTPVGELPDGLAFCIEGVASHPADLARMDADRSQHSDELQ
jgi:hypothetical protein